MQKYVLFAGITIMVFISGCISNNPLFGLFGMQVKEQRHDIIIIDGIQITPGSIIRSGQTATLHVYVKNLQTPEHDPIDAKVFFYNDCGLFNIALTNCNGDTTTKTNERTCKINNLHPQSTGIVEWKITAKKVQVENNCDIGMLVKYHITTPTTSSVTFVSKQEYERMVMQGKRMKNVGKMVAGEGPVKLYIEVPDQPILAVTSIPGEKITGENAGSGIMKVWAENKGNGELYANIIKPEDISIRPNDPNLLGYEKCIEKIKNDGGMRFIGRKTPTYVCEIYLARTNQLHIEKTYQINGEISYDYKFTKKINIIVKPEIEV